MTRALGLLCVLLVASIATAADPNPATLRSDHGAWPLYRQWTPAEVGHYAAWIAQIYQQKWRGTAAQRVAKLEGVLTDPQVNRLLDPAFAGTPSNPPLARETIRAVSAVLDCGNLAVILPAYYACRRGLPWMGTRVVSTDGVDLRRADRNRVDSEFSCRDFDSPDAFVLQAVAALCTGNYRINPTGPGANLSDTVPVAIDPRYLMPGALYYLDGHVAILGKVTPTGGLRFLDATLADTRDIYTHNGYNMITGLTPRAPGDAACLGCFRGFRIYRYPIAETGAGGEVLRVRRRSDAEMKPFGYSLEQYDLLAEQRRTGIFETRSGPVRGLHDFIRARMRTVDAVDPSAMLSSYATHFAAQLEARAAQVAAGWAAVAAEGPVVFPDASAESTIYNATGRWAQYTSLTRDMEIREDYFILLDEMVQAVKTFGRAPDFIRLPEEIAATIHDERALARWVMGEKKRIFSGIQIEWQDSQGQRRQETLQAIEARLFDLSFDPNHAPELRWGLPVAAGQPATFTPLASGGKLSAGAAFLRQSIYRTRSYRDTDPTRLRDVPVADYPKRDLFDAFFTLRWELNRPTQ